MSIASMQESTRPEHLLSTLESAQACVKFGASKALCQLARDDPARLYRHFAAVAKGLRGNHSILRWNTMLTLAHLAKVDKEKKLDGLLRVYLKPIRGPHLIDAGNTIRGAALIAEAKPYLAPVIVRNILKVERATYATPECRNIAIGHALTALTRLLPLLGEARALRRFATRQHGNSRPATRKKAEKLLARRSREALAEFTR